MQTTKNSSRTLAPQLGVLILTGWFLIQPVMAAIPTLASNQSKRPMAFELNQGQTDPEVKFLARGWGYTLFLTPTQCVLSLQHTSFRMDLAGANLQPAVESLDPLEGRANYFIGSDPKLWRTGVPAYGKVLYREVYPGIDLVYYGQQGQLEFDFVLRPGSLPESIRLQFDGADQLQLDAAGGLIVQLDGNKIRWPKPLVYQSVHGVKKEIQGSYVLQANRQVSFELSAYDHNSPLVIDPVLVYSSYVGGNDFDSADGLAIDGSGNVYLTGHTVSLNFPTRTAYRSTAAGLNDVFVTKFNSNGTALVYSTYLGGSGTDFAGGIAVDSSGNAYVTGQTDSPNFPTQNAYQSSLAGNGAFSDVFVVKLGSSGSTLIYSTYFGGSDVDYGSAIAVDSSGNAYITGGTFSAQQFPKASPFQNNAGGGLDAFVSKFSPTGSLIYSSWLGGNDDERGNAIAVDASGNAYVVGEAFANDSGANAFPTVSPLQAIYGGGDVDAFVAKIHAGGSGVDFATFLGGNDNDSALGVAVDAAGNVYVTGETRSTNFPTTVNALQPIIGGGLIGTMDGFVTKISSTGATLAYSTYLGGEEDDSSAAIAVDSGGQIYVTGWTQSPFDFPITPGADQATFNYGASDAFVAKLNPAVPGPSAMIYCTYWGGGGNDLGNGDYGTGIAVDANSNFYVGGASDSVDLLTTSGAFQRIFGGGSSDGFVAKFAATNDLSVSIAASPGMVLVGSNLTYTVQVNNNGRTPFTGVFLTNYLPGSVQVISMTTNRMTCSNAGGTIICNVGSLTNNASASVTIVVKTTTPTNLTDTAIVVANEPEVNTANNNPSLTTNVRGFADLAVGQIDLPDPVFVTSNLTYSIGVTNKGPWPATQIFLTEVFPPNVNFVTATQSQGDYYAADTNVLVFELTNGLAANAFATISVVVTPVTTGTIANQISVEAFEMDLSQPNNSSTITTTVIPLADLVLRTTTSAATVLASSNLTYTLSVSNQGPSTATAVVLTNRLPAGVTFLAAQSSTGCAVTGSVVTCNVGNLGTGAVSVINLTVNTTLEGSLTNISSVRSDVTDLILANNTVTNFNTVLPMADLALTASDVPDPVLLNSNLVYTLSVTNRGPSAAQNVTLTNTLSPKVNFLSAVPTQGSFTRTGNTIACSFGSITSGGNARLTITVTATNSGFITNLANVTATVTDANLANNSVANATRVNSPPTISTITNRSGNEDTLIGPIAFTIGDADAPLSGLALSASSGNPSLVSNANFTYGGSGSNRTLSIFPLTNQFGSATITVSVSDADGAITGTNFVLTVNPVNDPPTLNSITNVTLFTNSVAQPVNLSGITAGPTNEIQTLTVSATSSQPGLIPNPTVTYTSPNSTGTLVITHAPNIVGTSTITVTVLDSGGTANGGSNTFSRTFVATVNASPALRIGRSPTNNVVLLWPTNAPGFHLESRTNLSNPTNWITVTNVAGFMGDQRVVTNSLTNGNIFFRLRNP